MAVQAHWGPELLDHLAELGLLLPATPDVQPDAPQRQAAFHRGHGADGVIDLLAGVQAGQHGAPAGGTLPPRKRLRHVATVRDDAKIWLRPELQLDVLELPLRQE